MEALVTGGVGTLRNTGWKPQIRFGRTMEDLLNYWRSQPHDEPGA